VLGTVLLLTVPFAARPFHVDDDIYIKGAQQVLQDPLRPLGGEQNMLGVVMPTYHFTQHPPLLSYYLAAVHALTGRADEVAFHLAFAVFPLLAAAAFYFLARRFTTAPVAATLLLVTTPAFLVMAHGVMTDVPFLALYLTTTAALVFAIDEARPRLVALAAAALVLCAFLQYRTVILMPLLVLYAWLHQRSVRWALLACVPALVLLALWSFYTWVDLGIVHALDAGSWIELEWSRIATDAVGYLSFLGGATIAPVFLLYAVRRELRRGATWMGSVAAAAAALLLLTESYTGPQKAVLALFVGLAVATLAWLVPRRLRAAGPESGDELFLASLVLVPLLSQVFLNIFASARSLLIALPFVVILFVRRFSRDEGARAGRVLAAGTVLTAVMGLAVAAADYRFAQAAREVAQAAAAQRPASGVTWFTAEWGFRHYAEREGLRYLTLSSPVAEGDVLVVPDVSCPAHLPPALVQRLVPGTSVSSTATGPLTLMSFAARAGFYSSFWGLLPYSVSGAPLERATFFRVGPEVGRAPDEPSEAAGTTAQIR
jgi:4-amino-4-deoxy-L-arabinose transferase-like glycosyltransferase